MIKYLVQDIETIPESEIASMWDPATAPANTRYPEKEPFPPIWAHKVVCIGMLALEPNLHPKKGGCAAGGAAAKNGEHAAISRWSEAVSGHMWGQDRPLKMVDYNGRGFDVPVLQTRAFRYGIPLPWYFGLLPDNKGTISNYSKEYRDRYGGWHRDVQELWSNRGASRYPHLENLAKLMGLPGKCGFDGSDVHQAYKDGKLAEIDRYCMEDVFQTAFVFQRYHLLSGKIDLEKYRAAATALLDFIKKSDNHGPFLEAIDKAAVLLE